MKIKTSTLTDAALDWAVAKANGESWWTPRNATWDNNLGYTELILDSDGTLKRFQFDGSASRAGHWLPYYEFKPSTDWSQGGPIIEREVGNLWRWNRVDHTEPVVWCAVVYKQMPDRLEAHQYEGPTPLIAAMRCVVASTLGDEVDIPEELL